MKKGRNEGIVAIYITIIVLFAKILGFAKQMLSANYFGATIQTDLISISEGLITNLDYILVQTLSTAFVPIYIHAKKEGTQKEKIFAVNTIFVFLLFSLFITVILFFTAPYISRILAPSFSENDSKQLAIYIRLFSPCLIALVISSIFNSLLKGNESFIPGEIISVIQSVLVIVFILLFGKMLGVETLAYSFICYSVFSLLFLGVSSKKYLGKKVITPFKDKNVIKLLKMIGPLLLGYSIVFINQQVDKIIVSGLGDGAVTAMGYASVLANFVCTFIGSIGGVLFVYITQRIVTNEKKNAAKYLVNCTSQMITIAVPVFVLTIFNAHDIVSLVFGHGKFDQEAITTCVFALIGYGLMFIPYVLRELFSRFQYGHGDSLHPMINSSISIVINIILSIVLSRVWGVLGVTIATSLSLMVCGVLNILSSKRLNEFIIIKEIFGNIFPWVIGGVFCWIISLVGNKVFESNSIVLRLGSIIIVSCLGYFLINFKMLKVIIKIILRR